MSDAISLFDQMDPQPMRVPARKSDPKTSWDAAVAVMPAMPELYQAILDVLADGALTDEQLGVAVIAVHGDRWKDTTIYSARSRLSKELRKVRATDVRRRTSRGIWALTWELV